MKKNHLKKLTLLILAVLTLGMGAVYANDGLSGKKIAQMAKDANKSRNRIVWSKMEIFDNGKKVESRRMINKFYWKGGKERIVVRFMNGLKRNVTFLSVEKNPKKDNIQYIYLPGVGRPRQISSAEKQNDFEDTDMTNEDIGGRKVNDYNYKRLKDRNIKIGKEKFQCYVIIAKHKNQSVRFPKFRFWIDKKTLVPVKVKVYGKDKRLKRVGFSALVKELKKGVYMPHYMYMKDLERNHETKMMALKVKIDTPSLKRRQFSPSNLSKPWKER